MKYCEKCGNQLLDEAIMCPQCGCAVSGKLATKEQVEKANKRNKQVIKGVLMIIAAIMIVIFTIAIAMAQLG